MSYSGIYIEKELIGRGHFGMVYLVENRLTHLLFAAKKIDFQGISKE